MPGSIAAALPTIANVGGSIIGGMNSSNASSKAAAAQEAAQAANLQRANDVWTKTQSNLDPNIKAGNDATGAQAGLLGLGNASQNGSANDAFQRFLDSSGYKFQEGQGEQALNNANAMSFNSGATGKALLNYGQQAGRGALAGYMGNLGSLADRGVNASQIEGQNGNQFVQNAGGFATANANAIGANAYGQANANTGMAQGILGNLPGMASGIGGALSSFMQPGATPPAGSFGIENIPTLPAGTNLSTNSFPGGEIPNVNMTAPQVGGALSNPYHVNVGANETSGDLSALKL